MCVRLEYVIKPSGLSGLREVVDCVYSRAVLEHVNDLEATFEDMARALKPGGVTIHQVDLKSHGLHRENPLDFLTWPPWLWNLMYSGKGVPNRWRIDRFRQALDASGLELQRLEPTSRARSEEIAGVRPYLARPFKALPDEDLSWLGFWLIARKRL
jgi:SAM-dependent methyltransferase